MTWNEACSLDQSLLSLDSYFHQRPNLAELLTGGLTNRCWKIVANDLAFVWRPISSSSNAFGISRMREHRLLEALTDCHFAPNPVFLNEHGLLVEWLDEDYAGAFPPGETELVGTLAKIHSVDIHSKPIPLFSFTSKVDGYWHQLVQSGIDNEVEDIYLKYRELPTVPPVEPTLCHFDLGVYNLVSTRQGIKVIDWEYAGVGDPRMDLAMTIEVSRLDMPRAVAGYCKLRGITNVDDWFTGVNHWRPRNSMMAMLWYLLGYKLWQDERYLKEALELKSQF